MPFLVENLPNAPQSRSLRTLSREAALHREEGMVKLNLGCGGQVVPGWVNIDYSLGARLAKIPIVGPLVRRIGLFEIAWHPSIVLHDLRRPLPWRDESVDVIYTSHTLEHLSREDGFALIRECWRVLRHDGILRILVPDLRATVDSYLANRLSADRFIEALGVLYERSANPLKERLYPWLQFPHKCMYDTRRLVEILETEDFAARSCGCFDSDIEEIASIELRGRTQDSVVVEGRKRLAGR